MTFADVERARALLASHFGPTRLIEAASLSRLHGAPVYLKIESELPTGSFKPRGALYGLHRAIARASAAGRPLREVVAASTGNHGAAVAYAAHLLSLPATIVLPARPNPIKRARIAHLGARIVEVGGDDLTAAGACAEEEARKEGVYFLNDATDDELPAGPATIACEVLEQAPDVREIVVPMGDTALIRAVAFAAKHLRRDLRIVGVQAAQAAAYTRSWQEKRVVTTDTCDTIADGLATRMPLERNVREIVELVDDIQLVSEDEMRRAIGHLLIEEHLVAEPAGAAATAAFLQRPARSGGAPVALLLTGANIAPDVLRDAVTSIPRPSPA